MMCKILRIVVGLLCIGNIVTAQSVVTGKIVDEKGDPIPFSSVQVKGKKGGVTASESGTFSISVPSGTLLEFSSAGFARKEAPAGNLMQVVLSRLNTELSTIVITTSLGIKRESKELGYAETTIGNKFLTQAKSVNVQQALNGKISGLNIATVNSGVMEDAKINIRGIRSLTGNNQPMLVVDGAPTPLGYLSSIPPDDVQDLTVLKSAASAALYGPDAVNGVILITTKRGGKKPTITLSSTVEATKVAFFPSYQKAFGGGGGETTDEFGNFTQVPYENQQYGPAFDGSTKMIGVVLEDGTYQSGPYTNAHYQDKVKFWNSGLTVQNAVSVAGEDFYVSVQDANIKGLVPDDQNRRTSLRFNGSKNIGNFSVNYGLNYVLQNYNVINEAAISTLFPTAYNGSLFFLVMQTPSNVPLLQYKDWQHNKFAEYSNYQGEFSINPYWAIGNLRTVGRQDALIGNIDFNYTFFPWLKATARVSTSLNFQNTQNNTAPIIVSDWAHANRAATNYSNQPGSVLTDQNYSSRVNLDYYLSGDHTIARDYTIKYVLGGTIRQNRAKDVAVGGNDLVVPYQYNVASRSGDANVPVYTGSTPTQGNTGNNYNVEYSLLSAYGTVSLNYKGWANLELTGRNDWDSRLLADNRSFFYPAANAAIVLSDAIPSLQNSNLLSYLKLRGAWSKSGNVNLGPYALQATYSQPITVVSAPTPVGFPYGNTVGYTANNIIPNPNLKPEFVTTKEVGIEMGFLKNRINAEVTYYYQNNTNQILQVSQSATTGYPFGLANAADFKNYGVEMDLGLTPLVKIGKGRIELKVNATYNNNEITHTLGDIPVIIGGTANFTQIALGSPSVNNIGVVGKPAFSFQLTDYLRDPNNGKVVVDPITGYPTAAPVPVIEGRTLPLWMVGISPSYSIGNLSIAMTWDYKGGHDFYAGMGPDEDFAGISARSGEYGRKRFVFPNSEYLQNGKYVANTNIQVQDGNAGFWTGSATNTSIGTNYFASAAAWRLRELNISYVIPQKWIGNVKVIKRITVSAVGKNLFLFVPKSNQWGDPEFNYSTTGNTFGLSSSFQSPASRLFGGSITVQF